MMKNVTMVLFLSFSVYPSVGAFFMFLLGPRSGWFPTHCLKCLHLGARCLCYEYARIWLPRPCARHAITHAITHAIMPSRSCKLIKQVLSCAQTRSLAPLF